MIQTSEGNLPQGLDAAIRTGLERGRRTVARRARVRRGGGRGGFPPPLTVVINSPAL